MTLLAQSLSLSFPLVHPHYGRSLPTWPSHAPHKPCLLCLKAVVSAMNAAGFEVTRTEMTGTNFYFSRLLEVKTPYLPAICFTSPLQYPPPYRRHAEIPKYAIHTIHHLVAYCVQHLLPCTTTSSVHCRQSGFEDTVSCICLPS